MAVGFHEGGNSGMAQVGMDRFETRGARHIVTHTMEMMMACLGMIWGGVIDKHPKLRVAFLDQAAAGSCPGWNGWTGISIDQGFNDFGSVNAAERDFPAQLLDFVRTGGRQPAVLADYIGPHKILWATDYPHPDGFFPGAPAMVRKNLAGLSENTHQQSWPVAPRASTSCTDCCDAASQGVGGCAVTHPLAASVLLASANPVDVWHRQIWAGSIFISLSDSLTWAQERQWTSPTGYEHSIWDATRRRFVRMASARKICAISPPKISRALRVTGLAIGGGCW